MKDIREMTPAEQMAEVDSYPPEVRALVKEFDLITVRMAIANNNPGDFEAMAQYCKDFRSRRHARQLEKGASKG